MISHGLMPLNDVSGTARAWHLWTQVQRCPIYSRRLRQHSVAVAWSRELAMALESAGLFACPASLRHPRLRPNLPGGNVAALLSIRATAVVASGGCGTRQADGSRTRPSRIDAAGLRAAIEVAFGASDNLAPGTGRPPTRMRSAVIVLFLRRHEWPCSAKADAHRFRDIADDAE